MRHLYLFILLGFFTTCTTIEDASPADRATFIRFYEKNTNYTGVAAELTDDGFIVAGNTQQDTAYNAVITKTNLQGTPLWEIVLPNLSVKSIKTTPDGYLIFGDSIQIDRNAENVNDQLVTKARLIKMGINGETDGQPSKSLYSKKEPKIDFHGSALTFNDGQIITVGGFKSGSSPGRAFIAAHNPATLDTMWTQFYSLQDRDYTNSKSAYVTAAGKILWASSALKEQQSSSQSYVIVPVIEPNSTFINSSLFGENADQYYSAEDIQPSGIGYGIIGTYSTIQKTNSNIYFVRTDAFGNIIKGSEKYYDGEGNNGDILVNAADSKTEDKGTALAATSDGGFLLGGSLLTNTEVGNGGTDIFLIRVDAFGNVMWKKNMGGSGDESVSSIRTTSDGGFLVCGTSTVNGLSSVYIMKADKNGNIAN